MSDEFGTAFAALERRLAELERKATDMRRLINALCETAGLPPRYPDAEAYGTGKTPLTQIRPDSFYGKKQSTAIREYLEMRRAQGAGPAKPREIYDALKEGGYQFEAKDDEIALVGLRALLRKNTVTFHKLPGGAYGLVSWYPDAKKPKSNAVAASSEDSEEDEETETAASDKGAAAA